MLTSGDKLMVTKNVSNVLSEGDIVKILNISQDGVISFAFGVDFIHMGIMTLNELKEHFKRIELKEISLDEIIVDDVIEECHDDCEKCDCEDCELFERCNSTHDLTYELLEHLFGNKR